MAQTSHILIKRLIILLIGLVIGLYMGRPSMFVILWQMSLPYLPKNPKLISITLNLFWL